MDYSTAVLLLGIPIMAAALLRPFAWMRDHPATFKDKRAGTATAITLIFVGLAALHYYLVKLEEPPHDPHLTLFPVYPDETGPSAPPPPAPPDPPQQSSGNDD